MALTLTILSLVLLLGLTLLGALRGVPRGLLALIGTLTGALLADLWAPTWSAWLTKRLAVENPAMVLWGVTSLTFVLSVVLVGHASGVLLPASKPASPVRSKLPARRDLLALSVAALLGLYEGVLIAGFLLHYGVDLLKSESFDAAVQASLPARILHVGLGWAFLGPALLLVIVALSRLIAGAIRSAAARRRAAQLPPIIETPTAPPGNSQ